MDARVAAGIPLGDALDRLKEYQAVTMRDGKAEAERSAASRARRNTAAMRKLGVAAALGIGGRAEPSG